MTCGVTLHTTQATKTRRKSGFRHLHVCVCVRRMWREMSFAPFSLKLCLLEDHHFKLIANASAGACMCVSAENLNFCIDLFKNVNFNWSAQNEVAKAQIVSSYLFGLN